MSMIDIYEEIKRFVTEKNWQQYLAPVNRHDFQAASSEVNAFFQPDQNAISQLFLFSLKLNLFSVPRRYTPDSNVRSYFPESFELWRNGYSNRPRDYSRFR